MYCMRVYYKACRLDTMGGGNRQPKVLEIGVGHNPISKKFEKDEQFERLHGISKTQLYKMAGNSIVVDVLMAIFKNWLISEKEKKGQLSLF